MDILRTISAQYHLRDIRNMDESGLFFRMGPQRSYSSVTEVRLETRFTQFSKHRDRITMVLACNSDASRILPVRYIESVPNQRCFRTKSMSPASPGIGRKKWLDGLRWIC